MDNVPDKSVTLLCTSPPYGVDKPYEKGITFEEWYALLKDVLMEADKKLVDGARIAINIPSGIERSPLIMLPYHVIEICLKIGWLPRSWIVWLKTFGNTSCDWGSYRSPSNPSNRDSHEFILVFSKKKFDIEKGESGISGYEFCEFSRSEWVFNPESSFKGHPAPFPDELPRRCILFWTRIGDVVLDPFAGSCTTYKVALALDRKCYCYERSPEYIPVIQKRISEPLNVQSVSEKARESMEKVYPGLFDMTTKEIAKLSETIGLKIDPNESKASMMDKLVRDKKSIGLEKFMR